MKYLPEIALLVLGLPLIGVLLYLAVMSEGWVKLLAILGSAVVYTGWHRALLDLGWRLAGKDPDDVDFHFPG